MIMVGHLGEEGLTERRQVKGQVSEVPGAHV